MSHSNTTEDVRSGLSALDIQRLNYPKWAHQIVGGVLVLIGCFGFVENVLVIYTFTKNKHLLSPTNIFILGVAIGDLCMCCLGHPLESASAINGAWFAGDAACVLVGFVVYLFGLSQLYLLSAVSIDRYIVITKPLLTPKITTKVACASVAGCFGIALIWAVCPLIGWSSYGLEASGVFCGLHWNDVSVSNTSYVITITIFCFFFPLGIMIFCYYHVFMTGSNPGLSTSHVSVGFRFRLRKSRFVRKWSMVLDSNRDPSGKDLNVWTISYGFSPRDSNQEPSLTYQTEHQHESSPRKRLVIEFKCRSEYYPCQEPQQQFGMGYEQQNGSQKPKTRAKNFEKLRHHVWYGIYWIVWTPYAVVSFVQVFGDPDSVPLWMAELPAAVAKSQVVWNPIIYVGTNKKFMVAFYQVLVCSLVSHGRT
ncbi:visual pigment-like receptor peropsin [Dreissena polymorpha]|uniref:visual pigment-like receptor peropsin n=1 Tax=Dreissena polymorpha TaxID=45954 RepID=UPI00226444CE|nr:visual pigment-like receptor peropsin [Dreissena polymorpha]